MFQFHGTRVPRRPGPPHWGFTLTLSHTILGRNPPDEGSVRRRDLYHTTHKTLYVSQRDLNPLSQQASDRRPKLWSANLYVSHLQNPEFVLSEGVCLRRMFNERLTDVQVSNDCWRPARQVFENTLYRVFVLIANQLQYKITFSKKDFKVWRAILNFLLHSVTLKIFRYFAVLSLVRFYLLLKWRGIYCDSKWPKFETLQQLLLTVSHTEL